MKFPYKVEYGKRTEYWEILRTDEVNVVIWKWLNDNVGKQEEAWIAGWATEQIRASEAKCSRKGIKFRDQRPAHFRWIAFKNEHQAMMFKLTFGDFVD